MLVLSFTFASCCCCADGSTSPRNYGYPSVLHATCTTYPAHLILNLIILIILSETYEAPCYAVFSTLLSLHPFLVQIFSSNILIACSSLNVRDQVSHPYRTTDKIAVLYILIFTLDSMVASSTRIQFPPESHFDLLLSFPNISGCRLRKRSPAMEGSCKYIE
jgi:hypothetical protein